MHPVTVLQMLFALMLANGTPVIAKKLLGSRFAQPLDGGITFFDGRPLFGSSKTIRGVLLAVMATTAGAPVAGLDWTVGLLVGVTAMAGDLCSSFIKRRMNIAPHGRAIGLDQIPESLFPLLACRAVLELGVLDILVGVVVFFIGELVLSRLLFKAHIRDRPY